MLRHNTIAVIIVLLYISSCTEKTGGDTFEKIVLQKQDYTLSGILKNDSIRIGLWQRESLDSTELSQILFYDSFGRIRVEKNIFQRIFVDSIVFDTCEKAILLTINTVNYRNYKQLPMAPYDSIVDWRFGQSLFITNCYQCHCAEKTSDLANMRKRDSDLYQFLRGGCDKISNTVTCSDTSLLNGNHRIIAYLSEGDKKCLIEFIRSNKPIRSFQD